MPVKQVIKSAQLIVATCYFTLRSAILGIW